MSSPAVPWKPESPLQMDPDSESFSTPTPSPAAKRWAWYRTTVPATVMESGFFGAVFGSLLAGAVACGLAATGVRNVIDGRTLAASAGAGACVVVGLGAFAEGVRIVISGSDLSSN
jgi:hypothetical protein